MWPIIQGEVFLEQLLLEGRYLRFIATWKGNLELEGFIYYSMIFDNSGYYENKSDVLIW